MIIYTGLARRYRAPGPVLLIGGCFWNMDKGWMHVAILYECEKGEKKKNIYNLVNLHITYIITSSWASFNLDNNDMSCDWKRVSKKKKKICEPQANLIFP